MDFFDTPYFKVTKNLLSIMGIWPYQKPVSRYCFGGLAILVVIISPTPLYFFTFYKTIAIGDLDATLKVIPSYTLLIASQAKLCNLFFRRNHFKELLDIVSKDWKIMSNRTDKHVLFDYLNFGRKMTFLYCVYCYVSLFIFGIAATLPQILNVIFPLTESRPIYDLFYIEYYMGNEKYNLVYTIHILIICFGVTTIAIANESLEFFFVQHACVKFTILGHRIRNVMQHKFNIIRCGPKYKKENIKKTKIQKTTNERIILCIKEHKKILEFVKLLQSKFSRTLSFIVVDTMVGFFITGFQVVTNFDLPLQATKNGILLIGKLIHVYVQNWIGQRLIDHSNLFCASVYKSPWLEMTIKERRLLFVMLLRSQKPSKITAGVLCAMSIETFKNVLTMSMSYFTALNSLY